MIEINKDEMFGNLRTFLKTKGIEIQEGSYAEGIRKGCEILTDTVNMSQRAFGRAKDAMDKGLDQVRQTVHEATAPKSEKKEPQAAASATAESAPKTNAKKKTSAKAKNASATHGKKRGK